MNTYISLTIYRYGNNHQWDFGHFYMTLADPKLAIKHELTITDAEKEKENLEKLFGRPAEETTRITDEGETVVCTQIYGFVN